MPAVIPFIDRIMKKLLLSLALASLAGAAAAAPATVAELKAMESRFAPVDLRGDVQSLSAGDRTAIRKLIEAAKVVDVLQLRQRWAGNEALWAALKKDRTPLGRARLDNFWLNKGPWSIIDDYKPFLPATVAGMAIPAGKPAGGNFYPAGATKEQLEAWMNALPAKEKDDAQWFFTTIRAGKGGKYAIVKYSDEYRPELERAAKLLREGGAGHGQRVAEEIPLSSRGRFAVERLPGVGLRLDGPRFAGRRDLRPVRDL
jgi:hypothetical protein